MGRASGPPTRHDPYGHLYLHTIMIVLASVAATSFAILLLFSLFSCPASTPPHSRQRASEQAPPPRIRPTPTRALAIARPRGRFTACAHHRFRCYWMPRSSSRPSPCSSFPTYCPPPTVSAASRPTLVDAGTGRVGLTPGLSPCVPPRRTQWRLPRLGYLSDEESRSEILDN